MTAADPVEGLLGKHLGDLPSFVKDMRPTDAGLLYWAPNRSIIPTPTTSVANITSMRPCAFASKAA
jgi:hypothetical protein